MLYIPLASPAFSLLNPHPYGDLSSLFFFFPSHSQRMNRVFEETQGRCLFSFDGQHGAFERALLHWLL